MTKYKIIWSKSAKTDLSDIINYIKKDSKQAARKVLINLKNIVNELYNFPDKGRVIPELERFSIKSYRELILSPWRIFYKIEGVNIKIIAIIDGRRNIEDILLRRNIR